MKTYNMYVKTVIQNEQEKILLLKQKREDNKQLWDLPGSIFTEEQSFDETVVTNVQKEIGFYVYPGKIIGIGDYTDKNEKQVNVIMEGTILNGELLLSKDYEAYAWVNLSRIREYPLVPWLDYYINNNRNPFQDVESEIEEQSNKRERRRFFSDTIRRSSSSEEEYEESGDESSESGKSRSSFSLLKETIKKTFHPKQAKVTRTSPKSNDLHQPEEVETEEEEIESQLNIRHKKEESNEHIKEAILKGGEDDIIIEHDDKPEEVDDITIEHDTVVKESSEDIIIDHSADEEIVPEVSEDEIVKSINEEEIIIEPVQENNVETKPFDMNVNKQSNMAKNTPNEEPKIKIIREDDKTPHIRTEKEDNERISFSSESIRSGWKERLNRINRTKANDTKKEAPRPKGQRR